MRYNLLNKILVSDNIDLLPKYILRKIYRRYKIYFVPTNLKHLPINNHPIFSNIIVQENSSKKMENSIETPNDYPMMAFISKFFDVLAIINIVIGIIVFMVLASDGGFGFGLVALALSAISYGFCKLLSEVAKILSDIANNVKLIRSNSESLKK